MKYTRTICITFSSVLLGACVPPNVDNEAEQASLRATSDAYHEAAETNDMDSFVGFYTNDGVMSPPNAADEVGLQSVRNFATAFTQLPGFSMSFETVRVGVAASGDMGYTLSDGVVRFEGPDGTPVEDKIRDFHLWKKQNGEWKLAIDIWNSELPLPGAAAAATPLEGAWVVESWTDADGNTNDDPQPALYIFTPTHYSIMIAQGDEPRAGYEGDDMSDAEKLGDFKRGAALYNSPALACVACHAINGKGGQLGPELGILATHMVPEGILESLLKPSKQIKQGYESVVITLKNKEMRVGTLHRKTKSAVLLRDASGKITSVPSDQIATLDSSAVSIMPPGLTNSLRRDELLDLLHYLMNLK